MKALFNIFHVCSFYCILYQVVNLSFYCSSMYVPAIWGVMYLYKKMLIILFPFSSFRAPEQSDRPTFPAIFDVLNGPDTDLLKWSDEDVTKLSSLAMKLGAPLSEGKKMFPDLQHKNLVNEDHHSFLGTDV